MKRYINIFLVFLAVVFSWHTLGETALAYGSHDVATIEATKTKSASSTHPFGKARSLVAHNSAEGEVYTFNSLSCCNTIYNSQEDTYENTVVEAYVQRHAAILLLRAASIAIHPTIRTLLFPFHFFL